MIRYREGLTRFCARVPWLLCVLLAASSAGAQDTPSSSSPDQSVQAPPAPTLPPVGVTLRPGSTEFSGRWVPLGSAPVDQAGAGRRGYVLAGEDSGVTAAGSNQVSLHAVAANNFYRE